jgi:indolepyruvate ferredoxin oxidoreductase alpha subunit
LYRWQIQRALSDFVSDFKPTKNYQPKDEWQEIPPKENFCAGAGFDVVLDALEFAGREVQQDLVLVGDPGCLVTVAERLDAKYAIGSAIGVADGFNKVRRDERAVALFGDSAFFHTAIPALCNAVHNRSDILMVLLDNQSTASTGFQTNPGVPKDAFGHQTPGLSIEDIARVCGVKQVFATNATDQEDNLTSVFKQALISQGLTLVVVRFEMPH